MQKKWIEIVQHPTMSDNADSWGIALIQIAIVVGAIAPLSLSNPTLFHFV